MRNRSGWKLLVFGAAVGTLGEVYRNNGGLAAGADLLTGNGAIVMALGLGLVVFGDRARFGGEAEWRNRALGAALGMALSAVWRGTVEIAHAPGSGLAAWIITVLATALLLLPAVSCWAYVAATFLKRPVPGPTGIAEAQGRRTAA